MKDELKAILNKSERSMRTAEREFAAGNYDFACCSAYLAALYIIKGVLILDGHAYNFHRDILAAFYKEYVKKNSFSIDIVKHLKFLAKRREIGEFSFSIPLYTQEVEQCLLRARQVKAAVSPYLMEKLFKMA